MKQFLKSKWFLGVGGAVIGVAIFGVGVAVASIPSSNGVIWGCRNNITGSMKVIDKDAGQNCNGIETALNWNQTGPQGPQGPAGPTGPQGPSGFGDIEVITAPIHVESQTSNLKVGQAMCPTGKVATGGGFDGIHDYDLASKPIITNGKPVGWSFIGSTGLDEGASVYAICVSES